MIGNAVRILADDRKLLQHLREQPQKIDTFVEEALRLESPFRQQMRSVPYDTTLGGVDILRGATSPSDTASTTASERLWPASKPGLPFAHDLFASKGAAMIGVG